MSVVLHIPGDRHNVVEWRLVLNYMRTSPTHCFLESSGRVAYMEMGWLSGSTKLLLPTSTLLLGYETRDRFKMVSEFESRM